MEINRSYYQTPKPSFLMKLLWKAAGADKYLLERSTYSDQVKYMCMGGIIVATGVMASLAGGYAFYTIFSPKTSNAVINQATDSNTVIMAIIFGLIWGLIIFNIDRFIVTSTGKGDGTEAITWSEFKTAIPRIIMGAIIAFTISKPVEIRMFEDEINRKVQDLQDQEFEKGIDQLNTNHKKKSEKVETEFKKWEDEIKLHQLQATKCRKEVEEEITDANNNGANYGPRAKELERLATIEENQIKVMKENPTFIQLCVARDSLQADYNRNIEKVKKSVATYDGLLVRIIQAHELSPMVSWFITLLFLAIELTPIFFKLMLIKGPYDYLEENIKELIKAEQAIEIKYNFYPEKDGVEKHQVINHQVEKVLKENVHLLNKQEVVNKFAIDKWGESQKKKVDDNLSDFITEEK